jgi:hypothetical protein
MYSLVEGEKKERKTLGYYSFNYNFFTNSHDSKFKPHNLTGKFKYLVSGTITVVDWHVNL